MVHLGDAVDDDAVHRHKIAGVDDDDIPGRDLGKRNAREDCFALDPDTSRMRVKQALEQLLRAALGAFFEVIAGLHQDIGDERGNIFALRRAERYGGCIQKLDGNSFRHDRPDAAHEPGRNCRPGQDASEQGREKRESKQERHAERQPRETRLAFTRGLAKAQIAQCDAR